MQLSAASSEPSIQLQFQHLAPANST